MASLPSATRISPWLTLTLIQAPRTINEAGRVPWLMPETDLTLVGRRTNGVGFDSPTLRHLANSIP